jgi:hypothetical protein
LKKRIKRTPLAAPENTVVDVFGSGPVPIETRDPSLVVAQVEAQGPFLVRLQPGTPPAIIDSLLRYVSEFGQGVGTAHTVDGESWLELGFREDVEMLRSQFTDLLAETESVDGCCL